MHTFDYDLFICHASPDKDDVARPLSEALINKGKRVWFDEMTIKMGDSIRRMIEKGLGKSRYGVVILSKSFFDRGWTNFELDGLIQREMGDAVKVILPVWHNVTEEDVRRYSAPLAGRLGASTAKGLDSVVNQIMDVLDGPDPARAITETDDLAAAKQVILTEGLKHDGEVHVFEGGDSSGRYVSVGGNGYSDSVSQRKLFLYALEQLIEAGLVEFINAITYELKYPGIQVAQRMAVVPNPEKVGL